MINNEWDLFISCYLTDVNTQQQQIGVKKKKNLWINNKSTSATKPQIAIYHKYYQHH